MKNLLLLILLFFGGTYQLQAQQNPSLSNLRKKIINTRQDTLRLDSLSIVPGTFKMFNIDPGYYRLDDVNAILTWNKKPIADSALILYRVFPGRFRTVYQRMRFDSISNNFLAGPTISGNELTQNSVFDFGNISYNGSFGRGLSFGNRQDVVLNSTLNLQMSGYLADSIQIAAAITDSNIPIQPDGNTQNLNEFDRVFIQFKKNNWHFDIGDIDLRQQQNYFLNYYSRLQGASFEQETKVSTNIKNHFLFSGAIAKGKYTRNIFQGSEGNQGPYRLQGPNNELFFIVLAGTERVYIDGELMQRGEDQDYVINYNTAEVTFTPKRMISKDSRIQVEFGYADRNYLNSQLYLFDEAAIGSKLKIKVAAYSNADAKNSPINQTLDPKQKQFLADVGDSVKNALYPSQSLDTFSTSKILYKKIDTVYNNSIHDSVFVYTPQKENALYGLAFTEVGQGRGNYMVDATNAANGKVFKWVSPDTNNIPRGNYEPVILLIAPKKQQVLTIGAEYAVSDYTTVSTEAAVSNYNINSFSTKDKSDDKGYAVRFLVNDLRKLKGVSANTLKSQMSYEWVQNRFHPVERLRTVEFYRQWGLPLSVNTATEQLFHAGSQLIGKSGNSLQYEFDTYNRSDGYTGVRNNISQKANYGNWHFNNQLIITSFSMNDQRGYFFKPYIDVSRDFPKLGNHTIGAGYNMERNLIKYKTFDSLNTGSYSFDIWQLYIKSPVSKPNRWGITYFTRTNHYPYGANLLTTDRSNNINVYTELLKNEKHQFRVNVTYRNLRVPENKISNQKPEETILGRAEYFINEWKGMLNGNVLYEVGTGQEQKRNFTYVEVPAGQGEYTWNDYNNNGIQELNEFEIAQFKDQAKYIRIFTPTNEFIRANYLQFNYSFIINPATVIDKASANKFEKFLARLYFQSSLQVYKKEMSGNLSFNPFSVPITDTTLIILNQVFSNSFSFNRSGSVWGIDLNNIRSGNKAFLTYGYESRKVNDWNFRSRVNISRSLLLELTGKNGSSRLITPGFDNKNYNIKSMGVEPRISFVHGTTFRISLGYRFDDKKNTDSVQKATIHSITSEAKYNVLSSTSITGRFTFSHIKYSDPANANAANTAVSYMMLDALLPGKNYLWTMDLTRRLTSYLELNFQYEGRKTGTSNIVHIGRASLRALF